MGEIPRPKINDLVLTHLSTQYGIPKEEVLEIAPDSMEPIPALTADFRTIYNACDLLHRGAELKRFIQTDPTFISLKAHAEVLIAPRIAIPQSSKVILELPPDTMPVTAYLANGVCAGSQISYFVIDLMQEIMFRNRNLQGAISSETKGYLFITDYFGFSPSTRKLVYFGVNGG